MHKLVVFGLMLALATPAFAGLINGDWATGDETGWTRWRASWGTTEAWSVTAGGPTPPEGTLSGGGGSGSFGWFQTIECPVGWTCTVTADWAGNIGGAGWAEVMFWTQAAPGGEANRADTGVAADIAFKKDSWGMNPPTQWSWQPAGLSPHPSGNGGTVVSQGYVVVALKNSAVFRWALCVVRQHCGDLCSRAGDDAVAGASGVVPAAAPPLGVVV